MSFTVDEKMESFVASGDLSLCLNRVVTLLPADYKVGIAAAGNGYGVLANAPKDGEDASVVTGGVTMVRVGAAVTAGAAAVSAASGWAVVAGATKELVFGTFRTGAASGMLAAVKLERYFEPTSAA